MKGELIYFSCLLVMLAAMTASITQWKRLSKPDKILSVLLAVTIISEIIAYYFIKQFHNNMYVFHVYSPLELSFLGFYYNEAIPFFKKRKIGYLVAATAVIFAMINTTYFQPIETFPSLFLLFEGFIVIILSLFSFFSILYKEEYKLVANAQFWITFNLLIFWSFTFLIWGTYISFSKGLQDKLPIIFDMLTAINFITYLNYFIIFLFYSKMIRSGE